MWGKETLLWCFIYQRNHFPQIKTCSVLPVRLEQAARFLSWKLVARLNNAGRGQWPCHFLTGALCLTAGSVWIVCLQYLWHLNELKRLCHLDSDKCWNNRWQLLNHHLEQKAEMKVFPSEAVSPPKIPKNWNQKFAFRGGILFSIFSCKIITLNLPEINSSLYISDRLGNVIDSWWIKKQD